MRFIEDMTVEEYIIDSLDNQTEEKIAKKLYDRFIGSAIGFAIVIDIRGYSLDYVDWDDFMININKINKIQYYPDIIGFKLNKDITFPLIKAEESVVVFKTKDNLIYYNKGYSWIEFELEK